MTNKNSKAYIASVVETVEARIENGFNLSAVQADGTSTVKGESIEKYGPC